MSFNTAIRFLNLSKFLVVSFSVSLLISFNLYAQTTTTVILSNDQKVCESKPEDKRAACYKNLADKETEAKDKASEIAAEKANKKICQDAVEKFSTSQKELGKLCSKTKVSSKPLTCHAELTYCADNDNCDYDDRTGLGDKRSEYEEKREAVIGINDQINASKERISDLQQQISEQESQRDENLQDINQAAQDVAIQANRDLLALGQEQELALSESNVQLEQATDAVADLREFSASTIHEEYNNQIDAFTDECEQTAIDRLNALRTRLYNNRQTKRTLQSGLQERENNEALASKYIRACLSRTQRRQKTLLQQRDRALSQNTSRIERAERQIDILKEAQIRTQTRAVTSGQQIQDDANRAITRMRLQYDEIGRNTQIAINGLQRQIETENQKLGLQASRNPLIQPLSGSSSTSLYGQLAAAEKELNSASVAIDKAQKAGGRTIEQEDFDDLWSAKSAADDYSRKVTASCNNCTNETCKTAAKYQKPDTKAAAKKYKKPRSSSRSRATN